MEHARFCSSSPQLHLYIASLPGSAQLFMACSTGLEVMESWAGPRNETNTTNMNTITILYKSKKVF